MRERAALIGAQVDVSSEPGHGTTVSLTLPEHPVAASPVAAPAVEHAIP
jgi:two-component system nitrate/nitrite sensor histidine kinase NarX